VTFAWPALLAALLLVPLAVAVYVRATRRRTRYAVPFTNVDVLAGVVAGVSSWRQRVAPALYLVGLTALLLGLARPHAMVPVPREDASVVLILDTSGSMRATDVTPSRMEAAQGAARTFVDQLPPRFQVGLVSFASEAQVLAQPTVDRVAVDEAIEGLRPEGATAMGDAVVEALGLTDSAGGTGGGSGGRSGGKAQENRPLSAILLLSDGANTSGEVEPLDAAQRARKRGVPVYTIALGTPGGVVEAPDANGVMRLVPVPPDPETLQGIAEVTDAQSFTAPTEDDLQAIYEHLGSRIGFVEERREVTAAFAGAGLFLLGAAFAAGSAWGRRFP